MIHVLRLLQKPKFDSFSIFYILNLTFLTSKVHFDIYYVINFDCKNLPFLYVGVIIHFFHLSFPFKPYLL